jgi:DNA repair protein SbcC/Rad50
VILTELEIENYKHYGGTHRVSFREQGLVAVIGANGVGKTTLFEAIEWCLYKPGSILNDQVRTRNGTGPTEVRVTLADPQTGVQYIVERRLRRSGGVVASVYRADRPEAPIVQGTDAVTSHVTTTLIGLDYRAFVSTFFTRQKELNFFGSLNPTERRRAVSRLLGHDAIEAAQKSVAEARTEAKKDADRTAKDYADRTEGRDLAAECDTAERSVAHAEQSVREHTAATESAKQALDQVSERREALQVLEREDLEYERQLARVDSDRRLAEQQQADVQAYLAELERDANRRQTLEPVAAAGPERVATLDGHREELQREQARQQLRRQLDDLARSRQRLGDELAGLVASIPGAERIDGWTLSEREAGVPSPAAAARLSLIAALPVEGTARRAAAIDHCRTLAAARDAADQLRQQIAAQAAEYVNQRTAILADGNPEEQLNRQESLVQELRDRYATLKARLQPLEEERKQFFEIKRKIDDLDFSEPCRTCLRPFTPEEARTMGKIAAGNLERIDAELIHLKREMEELQQQGRAEAEVATGLRRRCEDLGRLATQSQMVDRQLDSAERAAVEARQALAAALVDAGLQSEPDQRAQEAARSEAATLQAVASTRRELDRIHRDGERLAADGARMTSEIDALGPSLYDPDAHRAAESAVQEARDARGQIEAIDERLARRPERVAALAGVRDRITALSGERDTLAAARLALGFDPLALAQTQEEERQRREAERATLHAFMEARTAADRLRHRRDQLVAEAAALAELLEQSNLMQREADDLDRMRQEFSKFDQYVAARVTPVLADRTAEILSAVTDGRYDRVEFDNDYGLRVYDDDRSFPLAEFSGGERDAVSLCARLALSTVIGAQATNPPRFVVLDEVFGSLDQHRRALVLETLRDLTGGSDALSQLFVISHVEDVNASPLVDEVWRITDVNGVSHLSQDERSGTMSLEMAEQLLIGEG